MNDLTHSVYVLQKRKENYRDQREKHTTSLRMQKDVSQKTAGDNEEMVANFARTEVLKEEGFFRTQKIINELQEKIRLEKERKAQLNKQELAALKFHKNMSTLERYPPFSLMRNSAIHRFEGVFSTESLITHYHTLITQEQHLNTRYLELTETEANLLNKLKRLQVDLEELVVGYFDYTELNKALKVAGGLGPTQNLIRLRVEECMDGRSIEQEHVEHEEMIQGYLLLFFLELKGKLSGKLVQLHGMLKEDYLLPEWKRMQRKGSMYGVLGLEETVGLSPVLQRLCNDVPPLKLNTTPEDIKSVVEDSQLTTVNAFTKLLAAAGQHFSEKLAFTLSDISSILSQLPTHTSRTLQELDRLSLAPDHFRAYIRSLPAPLQVQTTAAETPVSPLIQSLLEFRLTHIPTTDHQEEFDTFITQFSQGNIKNTLSSERLPESRQSKASSSEASDLGRLLLKSGSEDKKAGKHRINNSRNYEQTLLTAVAETESRIKEIEDRSNSHIERVTTRLQAQLHESNI